MAHPDRHGLWFWIAAGSAIAGLALFWLLGGEPHSRPNPAHDVQRSVRPPRSDGMTASLESSESVHGVAPRPGEATHPGLATRPKPPSEQGSASRRQPGRRSARQALIAGLQDLDELEAPPEYRGSWLELRLMKGISAEQARALVRALPELSRDEYRAATTHLRLRESDDWIGGILDVTARVPRTPEHLSRLGSVLIAASEVADRRPRRARPTGPERSDSAQAMRVAALRTTARRIHEFRTVLSTSEWQGVARQLGQLAQSWSGGRPALLKNQSAVAIREDLHAVLRTALEDKAGYRGGAPAVKSARLLADQSTVDLAIELLRGWSTVREKFDLRSRARPHEEAMLEAANIVLKRGQPADLECLADWVTLNPARLRTTLELQARHSVAVQLIRNTSLPTDARKRLQQFAQDGGLLR